MGCVLLSLFKEVSVAGVEGGEVFLEHLEVRRRRRE